MEVNRENELRKLLAEERQRSEQRKNNYYELRSEHLKLQQDYIDRSKELEQLLEETKTFKQNKEADILTARQTIEERDRLIENLRKDLKELDVDVLREKAAEELRKPLTKVERERDILLRDKERQQFKLENMQQKIEHLEKELIDKVERQKLAAQAEINQIKQEKEELKVRYMESNKTPQGEQIMNLQGENDRLKNRLKETQQQLDENQKQFLTFSKKLESVIIEQERSECEHEKEKQILRQELLTVRQELNKQQEFVKQLNREKSSLIGDHKRLEISVKKEQENVKIVENRLDEERLRWQKTLAKEKNAFEIEQTSLNEQMKKLKDDLQKKTEEIERHEKTIDELEKRQQMQLNDTLQLEWKERHSLERDKSHLESRLRDVEEEKAKLKDEYENLRRNLISERESRLTLEKNEMILKAKLETMSLNQEEIEKLRRQQTMLYDELNKIRAEYAEMNALNKDLNFQKERFKDEHQRLKLELDDERKELIELKLLNESSVQRLKECIDDERTKMKVKFDQLHDDLLRKTRERDEFKIKCREYSSFIKKLQEKLNNQRENHESEIKRNNESGDPKNDKIHCHLQKQYKLLKKRQDKLASTLLEIAKEASPSTNCHSKHSH